MPLAELLKRWRYNHPVRMMPTLVITLEQRTQGNINLLERVGNCAKHGNPFHFNGNMYAVAYIQLDEIGQPIIGLTEL